MASMTQPAVMADDSLVIEVQRDGGSGARGAAAAPT
jgi:hypothetical protein